MSPQFPAETPRWRPRIRLHFAQSVDGAIGYVGERTAISSAEGIAYAHDLRRSHDGVLVGRNTVAIDDPQLTCRAVLGRDPRPIVLSSSLYLPPNSRLRLRTDLVVVGTEHASTRAHPVAGGRSAGPALGTWRVVEQSGDGRVDLRAFCTLMLELDIHTLLVEGGAQVLTAFMDAGLFDELSVETSSAALLPRGDAIAPLRLSRLLPDLARITRGNLGHHTVMHGYRIADGQ
jgi:diaminohydroxyphosphoribosylaminopyrimidine deaminase / 5-amino-6-(5-phosphoribosylamino)uracil reductase